MYTEPHHIDIDIVFTGNGATLARGLNFNEEEVGGVEGEEERMGIMVL